MNPLILNWVKPRPVYRPPYQGAIGKPVHEKPLPRKQWEREVKEAEAQLARE